MKSIWKVSILFHNKSSNNAIISICDPTANRLRAWPWWHHQLKRKVISEDITFWWNNTRHFIEIMCNEESCTIRSETCFKNGNRINLDFTLTLKSIFSKLTPLSQAKSEVSKLLLFFPLERLWILCIFHKPYMICMKSYMAKCHYNYDLCIYEFLKKKRSIFNGSVLMPVMPKTY